MYLTKVKLELAQVFHLNWDEGLHLDLGAIKSCEVSCACGIRTHRNVSWVCTSFLSPWAQILQKNLINAEPDPWASREHNVRGTSQAPMRVSGCLPGASWGIKLLRWALLSVVFSVPTQPAQVKALQTAVITCWSCVLLPLDSPIHLCLGQALLLMETMDPGRD